MFDAVVVGSGPNGLAAAVTLARAGQRVCILEANESPGGGARSAELTLPGFVHDTCSAVHPMAASSPFFRQLDLESHGLEWLHPEILAAHPFDDGSAAALHRSLNATAFDLGPDGPAYRDLMAPIVDDWRKLAPAIMSPVIRLPRYPIAMARFGGRSLWPASRLARRQFRGDHARALFAGIAAHATLPLDAWFTASFGFVLGAAGHADGWPVARGGSQRITDALISAFRALGGEVECGRAVRTLADLPAAKAVLFDLTPRQLLAITGNHFRGVYHWQLERWKYGASVFKLDYALSGPVPWTALQARRAGTVHAGGTLAEVARAEWEAGHGLVPERPFVIAAQQSLVDSSRAPEGCHTFWAYCHVPHGCDADMTERIEAQIERFAPGFRDLVLARHITAPAALESGNANYIGGDITGGSHAGLQLFFRPAVRWNPYRTPDPRLFLCSSSTPPGAGVHGMCGYHAARAALGSVLR